MPFESLTYELAEEDTPTTQEDGIDNAIVKRTIEDLLDDYERQGHKLLQTDVDRLLDKRGFTPKQSLYVYNALSTKGIELQIEELNITLEDEEQKDTEDYDYLGALLRDASRSRLLTAEEEIRLGRAISLGLDMARALKKGEVPNSNEVRAIIENGSRARDQMIRSNMRLVVSIAKHHRTNTSLSLLDLIQEGMIGLMKAAEKFDHTKGFKFSTYAVWWIRQSIYRALDDKGTTIRIPVHMAESVRKYRRARNMHLALNGGTEVSLRAIANELGWTYEQLIPVYQASLLSPISLDVPTKEDADYTLKDFLVADCPNPEECYEQTQLSNGIEEVLGTLTEREADIIKRRFGLDGHSDETLEQVGNTYNITRERIRQIEAKALSKLRRRTRKFKVFIE